MNINVSLLVFILLTTAVLVSIGVHATTATTTDKAAAIERFRRYLQIKTVHPTPDYLAAARFLKSEASRIGLIYTEYFIADKKPIVVLKWSHPDHTDHSLKGIMLNSHTDVVPVDLDKWSVDPFAAHYVNDTTSSKDQGKIFARGAQDMKCVGMQYLEAIDYLKNIVKIKGPKRPVYVTFVPDEEIGGKDGMEGFVLTDYFKVCKC